MSSGSSAVLRAARDADYWNAFILAVTSAISITIGVYWSSALQQLISNYVPKENSMPWIIGSAILVTLLGVAAIVGITRFSRTLRARVKPTPSKRKKTKRN